MWPDTQIFTDDLLFDHWLLMSHVVLSHQHVLRCVENKPILGWHHQNHHQCHTENHVIPSSPEKLQYTYAISGPSLGTTMLMMVANKPVLSRGQFLRCAITEYTGSDCVTDTISFALVSPYSLTQCEPSHPRPGHDSSNQNIHTIQFHNQHQ